MSGITCPTCGQPMQGDDCPRCRAATAFAKPEDAEQAKVTPQPREAPTMRTSATPFLRRWLVLGFIGGVLLLGGGVVAIVLLRLRDAENRARTMQNLADLGIAHLEYTRAYKHRPSPQVKRDGSNHSWRLEILPYTKYGSYLDNFKPKLGWNHPDNEPILNRRPPIYENLTKPALAASETHFQLFTGPNTIYRHPDRSARFVLDDGLANTFLAAEAATPVAWTKPVDMVISPTEPLPLPPEQFLVLVADGTVRMMDRNKASDTFLRQLIDPSDGEPGRGWESR